jgi:hypothetical protein
MAAPGNIRDAPKWLTDLHTNEGLRPPKPSILQNVSASPSSEMSAPASAIHAPKKLRAEHTKKLHEPLFTYFENLEKI